MIISPTIASVYYKPTLSGEDYMIGGLKWLGENGDHSENVMGYGLRTVPVYTNMSTAKIKSVSTIYLYVLL